MLDRAQRQALMLAHFLGVLNLVSVDLLNMLQLELQDLYPTTQAPKYSQSLRVTLPS